MVAVLRKVKAPRRATKLLLSQGRKLVVDTVLAYTRKETKPTRFSGITEVVSVV